MLHNEVDDLFDMSIYFHYEDLSADDLIQHEMLRNVMTEQAVCWFVSLKRLNEINEMRIK